MIDVAFTLFSIFPVSFLVYSWTERVQARHESRVGKDIALTGFFWQTWVDTLLEVRTRRSPWVWLFFGFQCALPFLYVLRLEYLVFPWMVLAGFSLAAMTTGKEGVLARIDSDQRQVAFAVASGISLLCIIGGFSLSGTADLGRISWSPLHLIFVIPFQIAGMILFQEHPFRGFLERASWLESVRFYGWCMVTVRLFLGGGEYFLDFNLKAGLLFLVSRLFAIYFPRLRQEDLLRVSMTYLLPLTGVFWLVVMLAFALMSGGSGFV
ncbi:MAG: NADH-quinone oxidoreductase subunit H [Bdellovibrionales bacterium]|nr:NADH-quinone oxidoreductase subunit H [Bdellovibrionales bacterium]